MEHKWLDWAKQLQSLAQAGLAYSKDIYDVERFELIRNISVEMLSQQTGMEMTVIKDLFASETGYATPKVDIRAVIFKDNKILMVKENSDGSWSLPGGWADIGLTPSEVAVKEVKEESGFDVKAVKLLAVMDMKCHPHPPSPFHIYKMFIQCEIIGGQPMKGVETSAVEFFAENKLPPLSIARNTQTQIEMAFKHLYNPKEPVYFD
ncbi:MULTISPECIES: NUDIX hydrolase [Priestia]|uniref:NUDIX hydrolase n=1 Tax=Priestia TaxID=2800373 RepID=UPI000708F0D2|nr:MULTISPECIES: NUDIX hydrolase [Priestia]KRF51461.1 ADP-ribose pyrophosphatase [Bacillus sp. Soil531]MBZ5482533.1 NUDIX hydrolase [Bacillus sp. T_4]RFB33304.1 NUDIX domain-containing protein [Bacillus sp. RC]MBD8114882.1 NUDIX hydrolase [Priestia megaterium]MBM6602228.1 NUDIX hydrolase [Priestia megaterium]